jgi:hypothetical protein
VNGVHGTAARTAELAAILRFTTEIRAEVEAGEWARAGSLDLERRAALERLFDERPQATELAELAKMLKRVIELNEEILGLMAHKRRTLDREADLLATGRRAGMAYLATP